MRRHYYPILRGKTGELEALDALEDEEESFIAPIIEIPRVTDTLRKRRKFLKAPDVVSAYLDERASPHISPGD